jgi:ABC-type multidrug transport system permease subunit
MTERARHPVVELTLARFREFIREPEAIFWVFAFPVLMTLALGIAFRTQRPQPVPVGVAQGEGDRAIVDGLAKDAGIAPRLLTAAEADVALRNGAVSVVVVPGTPPTFRFDPTRPESRIGRLVAETALQRAAGRSDAFRPRDVEVMAKGARYIDWLVPGLLGMNIMSTGLWGIGFAVVQARTRKLLKRLTATPMRRSHYLASHVLARLAFLALEAGVLVGFAWLVFDIPIAGSIVTLGLVCLLGALSFGGLGLLLASRAKTVEAVSGLMNLAMLPMWVLSGVFFSSENFPRAMQPFIQAIPLTALNQALRAVMIDGASWTAIPWQVANLVAWGAISFVVAVRIFRWQ